VVVAARFQQATGPERRHILRTAWGGGDVIQNPPCKKLKGSRNTDGCGRKGHRVDGSIAGDVIDRQSLPLREVSLSHDLQ
jgi:hypothetical protein